MRFLHRFTFFRRVSPAGQIFDRGREPISFLTTYKHQRTVKRYLYVFFDNSQNSSGATIDSVTLHDSVTLLKLRIQFDSFCIWSWSFLWQVLFKIQYDSYCIWSWRFLREVPWPSKISFGVVIPYAYPIYPRFAPQETCFDTIQTSHYKVFAWKHLALRAWSVFIFWDPAGMKFNRWTQILL